MEQIDTLKNGYKIIQDTERFMFGIDAVLLADFVRFDGNGNSGGKNDDGTDGFCGKNAAVGSLGGGIKRNDKIIDLGTGNGIIPLLLSGFYPGNCFTGLEIQKESAELAARSVELNNLQDKIRIINGDLKKLEDFTALYELAKHGFDVVTCNPPYSVVESGKQNPKEPKAIARHELLCTLEDVVAAADFLLKPHGKFFMIHRPYRLAEIFGALYAHQLEPKRMRLVSPFAGEEPNMVLIEARKNARPSLKIEAELAVYEKCEEETLAGNERRENAAGKNARQYTRQVQEIYERQSRC